jgi:hypothetical protein
MFAKDLATMQKMKADQENERRGKFRFPMRREMRYKLLKDGSIAESGAGETVDLGSGGVGFSIERELPVGAFIELSISWPVLLDQSCPMRLNVFGRVVRNESGMSACTIDKYEFRTQSRAFQPAPIRNDSRLQRWADGVRKDNVTPIKPRVMTA